MSEHRNTVESVLKHVARFHTRDERVTEDQWRAVWDARLIRANVSGNREWTVTETGTALLYAFTTSYEQAGVPGYPTVTVEPGSPGEVIVTGAPNGSAACDYAGRAGYNAKGSFQRGTAVYRVATD